MSRLCLICTVPIDVTHLGIDACRACAAFFKRTKVAGRTYTCRQGDRNCSFRKHEKFMCRSCRLDKCIQLGMEYDTPTKRRPRKKVVAKEVEKEEQPVETGRSNDPSEESSALNTPPSTSASTSSTTESIIDKMRNAYLSGYEQRMVDERKIVTERKLKRLDFDHVEVYASTISAFYDVAHLAIRDCIGYLQSVFGEFDGCSVQNKATLFKQFFGKFCMVEYVYYSAKYFKDGKHFMASLLTCMNVDNIGEWVTDADKIERKQDFKEVLNTFCQEYTELLAPMLLMEALTEREFHALMVLSFCDVEDIPDLPEAVHQIAAGMRARVFEELQDFYRNELNLVEYSKRLGNLMTILHGAREAGALMTEEMRMYATMFDIYSDDQLLREVFFD